MPVAEVLKGISQELEGCAHIVRRLEDQILGSIDRQEDPAIIDRMQDVDLLMQTLDDIAEMLSQLGKSEEAAHLLPVHAALSGMRLFDVRQRIAGIESLTEPQESHALLF